MRQTSLVAKRISVYNRTSDMCVRKGIIDGEEAVIKPAPTSRRDFLRLAGSAAAVFVGGGAASLLSGCTSAAASGRADPKATTMRTPIAQPTEPPDKVEIALKATESQVSILPGQETRVWAYRGEVLTGDTSAVQHLSGSYLGPILHFRKGQKVTIHFTNELPERSIVHWHGLHVPQEADGHPRLAVDPGETYTYEFEVANRAGTYWYHPHPHGRTGPQVYNGLAGLLLISDDEGDAAGLPAGEYDVPLVIQDRTFDQDNQFIYLRSQMDRMMGFLGDRILVNGQPDFILSVATRVYRLRILNGSNSRTYKLGWHDGTPLTVIATDGGLLEKPVQREYVMLSPGERVELWADFSGREVGSELRLQSLPFFGDEAGGMGMMGRGMMMGGGSTLPNGSEFTVLRVYIERQETENLALPGRLAAPHFYRPEDAVNRRRPRSFDIAMQRMNWFLNGRTFEMEGVAADEVVKLGDLEIWEFVNQNRMMTMIHPMHVHNVQFQVLERKMLPTLTKEWKTVRDGYVDEGWKDTVLLMPGERVKILLKFEDFAGLYLYHCHNLEHEDLGLMRNYSVKA
jgi:FtsP/CotA-like multicopper oxidase with cupredoxin domain